MKNHKEILTSAMEDYLEMIYRNSLENGYIRINTLSHLLNVQASSTSRMVQKLTGLGFIDYKKYGIIVLTDNGKEIGKFLLHRHDIIKSFFEYLGVDENLLIETELIEHNLSVNTLQRIELLNNTFNQNPDFIQKYQNALKNLL